MLHGLRFVTLLGALGCAADPAVAPRGCGEDDDAPATPWSAAERVRFGADGLTAAVTVEPGFYALTLADPARCAQVESAFAGAAELVPGGSRGVYCTDCARRVMGVVGGGLFAFSPPELPGEGRVTLRFGLRDCTTWTPLRAPAPVDASLRTAAVSHRAPETRLHLRVDVAYFGDVWLRAPGAVDALLREASGELTDARIALRRSEVCALPAPAEALTVQDYDHGEIARWTALARARCPALRSTPERPRLTLLVAPCVRTRDTLRGEARAVDGYTTHIPGGALAAETPDAVLLSAGCGATLPLVAGVPLGLGRVLAHEVGHFLGLFHTSENDGRDQLDAYDDSTEENLMNAIPLRERARGLSRQQVAALRVHPWLRRPLVDACAE